MAFDSLTEKLQNVFRNLRSKGRLTEDDVKTALKEVKMALLEADVNFKVVKGFIKDVQERAVGQDVMNGLNPGQMVIKIVNEELIKLMGSETTEIRLQPGSAMTVIMMAGLQGAGKTTTTAKLAGKFKLKGKKPLLVACDVYRPAAIKQLQINGEKQGVEVFSMGDKNRPADIAKAAVQHAAKNGNNIVILDTAGRLHIDEDMMAELQEIKETVEVHQTILVVDAMTGQDAVNVAGTFNEKIGIDGVESNLGTAIRTCVVLIMAWIVVFASGKRSEVLSVPKKELSYICLSGLATGASWLCYYKALQLGTASKVAPVDKFSLVITVIFAFAFLHEQITLKMTIGLVLITAGTLLMVF